MTVVIRETDKAGNVIRHLFEIKVQKPLSEVIQLMRSTARRYRRKENKIIDILIKQQYE